MARDPIPKNLYQYLVVEARGLCSLCHEDSIAQMHHIQPCSDDGTSEYENLIPLCASCHTKVHKTDPTRLVEEKARWVAVCKQVIAEIIESDVESAVRSRQLLDAYDAIDDVPNFLGFKNRLSKLLISGEVFKNLFRIRRHQIRHVVDSAGNSKTSESQVFSPFVGLSSRQFHLMGDHRAAWEETQFKASATVRRKSIPIDVSIRRDDPNFKSVEVAFEEPIQANMSVQIDWSFSWPQGWELGADRYTYDVLAYVEQLEYEMEFPEHVTIGSVSASFIDLFGREWPRFGKNTLLGSGFRWVGTRLPVFSSVVIKYSARTDQDCDAEAR